MALLLLLAFNWFILYQVLLLFTDIFYHPHYVQQAGHVVQAQAAHHVLSHTSFLTFFAHYHDYINMALAFLIVCGLALLFNSGVGEWLLRFIFGARKAIEREKNRLEPIIKTVQGTINDKLKLKPIENIRLEIMDDPMPEAAAIGKNTLIISRALYETASDEEIAGVITHELAHLHNGDSNRLGVAVGVSIITVTLTWLAALIATAAFAVSAMCSKMKGDHAGLFFMFIGFIIGGCAWIFLIFAKAGNWVLNLVMLFQGRKAEYKADKFAIQAGLGKGLVSFLEKIKDLNMTGKQTIRNRMYATHPPVMLRIGKMEEYLASER